MPRHVVDDLARHGLAQREVVAVRLARLHHLHERLDRERVVLARDGELRAPHRLARVLLLDARRIVEDLPRGGEELLPFARHRHAAARPREDRHAQLLLERAERFGQRGLRHEQPPRRLADRAGRRDGVRVFQLLQCHGA